MVWDYAIESSDDALLTALVQVYKQTKGISEKGQHMFKGMYRVQCSRCRFKSKNFHAIIRRHSTIAMLRYISIQRNKAMVECRRIYECINLIKMTDIFTRYPD